ncbi:hypothetical protein DXG01_006756, partial [Tephrocybe rancida]
ISLPPDLMPFLSNIKSFLVDIPQAECQLGTTCLDYLLMQELESDVYFRRPEGFVSDRPSFQSFAKRQPFFNYALVYWPEYAVNVFGRSKSLVGNALLASKTVRFVTHPFSIMWLEEYIHQLGIEITTYTIYRFAGLSSTLAPHELLRWAEQVTDVFDRYSKTISTYPSAIRKCLLPLDGVRNVFQPHCQVLIKSDYTIITSIPPPNKPQLERVSRGWLYHDTLTDTVLSVERSSKAPSLRRQVLATGIRFRPALFEDVNGTTSFSVRSAAVGARMGFIAVTFSSVLDDVNSLTTVCWSLVTSTTIPRPSDDWAQIAFVETLTGPELDKFESSGNHRISVLTFGADNTLITPGGIWDILSEERTDGPATIFDPDPQLNVRETCFSYNGKRVARVATHVAQEVVEVLDIGGHYLHSIEFPLTQDESSLDIFGFSDTGRKIIVGRHIIEKDFRGREQHFSTYVCFETEGPTRIPISLPDNETDLGPIAFTKDEDKMVSSVNSYDGPHQWVGAIVVWSLSNDGEDHDVHASSPIHLFKGGTNIEFCLTRFPLVSTKDPQLHDGLILITDCVYKRQIDCHWSQEEEDERLAFRNNTSSEYLLYRIFLVEKVVRRENGSLALLAVFQEARDLQRISHLESWLLGPQNHQLLPTISTRLRVNVRYYFTSTGSFLTAENNRDFYRVNTSDRLLNISPLDLPFSKHTILGYTFAADDTRVAFVRQEDGQLWVSIFDVKDGDIANARISQFPSQENDGLRVVTPLIRVAFGGVYSELLAISYGRSLDGYGEEPHKVTVCLNLRGGGFQYSKINGQLAQSQAAIPQNHIGVPTILELHEPYVHSPHIWELRLVNRTALFLDRKPLDQGEGLHHTRLICFIPDALEVPNIPLLTLIWSPDEELGEVRVVMREKSNKPVVIRTGIRSSEMMQEQDWFSSPPSSAYSVSVVG